MELMQIITFNLHLRFILHGFVLKYIWNQYLNLLVLLFSCFVFLSDAAKCIDHYTKLRVENTELPEGEEKKRIDPRLEGIVNKMFLRCLDDHKYKQAIGIALETRRLDMFEKTILESVSVVLLRLVWTSITSCMLWLLVLIVQGY